MKKIALTAVLSSVITLCLVHLLDSRAAAAEIERGVILENARVEVTERTIPPGAAREPQVRPTDQVIVFLNAAEYDRIDAETGEKATRKRKAGEVIWHSRGEFAPKLVNVGKEPLRSLVIAIK